MSHDTSSPVCTTATMGLDVGDRSTSFCVLEPGSDDFAEGAVGTDRDALSRLFSREPCRVVVEACGHVHWINELATAAGHEVIVANPREVRLISQSHRKTDRNAARTLTQLGRVDPSLLRLPPASSLANRQRLQAARRRLNNSSLP